MRIHPIKSAAVISCAAALALTGCTTGDEASSGGGGSEGGGGGEIESIGLMVQDLSNPFFAAMQKSVEAKAEEMGATVSTQDGRQDLAAQNNQIEAFIQQGTDVILLNAVDSAGIGSAVTRAQNAGITVVAVDVTAKGAEAFVTTDNVEAGSKACKYLFEQMGGEGNILVADGTPISSVQDRVKGCEEVLKEYPDIKVVGKQSGDNGRSMALTITTDMLTANSNVDGIFAINDPTALGAALAVQQAGRDGIPIVGVDGSPAAVEELKEKSSPFIGTSAQDPGQLAVRGLEIAQELISGSEPDSVETEVLIPTKLVTKKNVDDYKGWE